MAQRRSATFDTKAKAAARAARIEAELAAQRNGRIPNKTCGDLLVRHRDEVSVTKRGQRMEVVHIDRMLRGCPIETPLVLPDPIVRVKLAGLEAFPFRCLA